MLQLAEAEGRFAVDKVFLLLALTSLNRGSRGRTSHALPTELRRRPHRMVVWRYSDCPSHGKCTHQGTTPKAASCITYRPPSQSFGSSYRYPKGILKPMPNTPAESKALATHSQQQKARSTKRVPVGLSFCFLMDLCVLRQIPCYALLKAKLSQSCYPKRAVSPKVVIGVPRGWDRSSHMATREELGSEGKQSTACSCPNQHSGLVGGVVS